MVQERELSRADFATTVKKLVPGVTDQELDVLYDQADTNKDGTVQWEEFEEWVMHGKFQCAKLEEKCDAEDTKKDLLIQASTVLENADESKFAQALEITNQLQLFLKAEYATEFDELEKKENTRHKRGSMINVNIKNDGAEGTAGSTNAARGVCENDIISYPYTTDMCKKLLFHFVAGELLEYRVALQLLDHFREERAVTSAVQEIQIPEDGKFILVGDTHGHFEDVFYIFQHYGLPSAKNIYFFNGDIADRGARACEIFFVLFAFSLAEPGSVYFNRGNHENELMNRTDRAWGGGFYDEVAEKYNWAMYEEFRTVFMVLGLTTIVSHKDKKFFIVHGGLCRIKEITLSYLSQIKINKCTAPDPMSIVVRDQVFMDLLWSDPQEENGKHISPRGLGIMWGPDVTQKFLKQQDMEFIVRSHECPANNQGYALIHKNKVITIFSASNYLSRANLAAVMLFDGTEDIRKYKIRTHFAPPLEFFRELLKSDPNGNWAEKCQSYRDTHLSAIDDARNNEELMKMKAFLILHKPEIYSDLVALNQQTGDMEVTPEELASTITLHINEEFPWKQAFHSLGAVGPSGKIQFANFLSRFHVRMANDKYSDFKHHAVKKMYESFVAMDLDIEETIRLFDKNNDGYVDFDELMEVLKQYDLGLSESQVKAIVRSIFVSNHEKKKTKSKEDSRKDDKNRLKVEDFLERFTMVYSSSSNKPREGATVDRHDLLIDLLGKLLMSKECEQLILDQENAARRIQHTLRKKKEAKDDPEPAKKGLFDKFTNLTSTKQTKMTLTEKLNRFFIVIDSSEDGLVQIDEFVDGFSRIPKIFDQVTSWGEKITKELLEEASKLIDVSGSGTINYLEFLAGFQPKDEHGDRLMNDLYEDICTVLFRHCQAIRAGCSFFDRSNTGKVPLKKFIDVIRGINRTLGRPAQPFRESQIQSLGECASHNGIVDYADFLSSFVLSDSQNVESDQAMSF